MIKIPHMWLMQCDPHVSIYLSSKIRHRVGYWGFEERCSEKKVAPGPVSLSDQSCCSSLDRGTFRNLDVVALKSI